MNYNVQITFHVTKYSYLRLVTFNLYFATTMSQTSYINPESTQQLYGVLEPYFAKHHRQKCYVGLIFNQGKRTMVQINVPADDLPTLLQAKHSQDNDPDSGKNRPEVKGHVEEVKEYVLKRVNKNRPWILGTLTANVDPEKIKVVELGRGICFVVIPRGVKLDITDGQHRKRAIHELIESQEGELIGDNDFPITLVLEKDFKQCQIDFRDMAQTRKLDKSLLLSFGEFEGRIGIVKSIVEQVPMFYKKTELITSSPSTKKKLIFTMNYLARFVSCAFTNNPANNLEDYDVETLSNNLASSLNLFFEECADTRYIHQTLKDNLTVDDVATFKENCILSRSVGIEILGRLFYLAYDEYSNSFKTEKVLQLAQLDWSRSSNLWQGNIILPNIEPNQSSKASKPYKVISNASAVKVAINLVKNNLGWV